MPTRRPVHPSDTPNTCNKNDSSPGTFRAAHQSERGALRCLRQPNRAETYAIDSLIKNTKTATRIISTNLLDCTTRRPPALPLHTWPCLFQRSGTAPPRLPLQYAQSYATYPRCRYQRRALGVAAKTISSCVLSQPRATDTA